MNTVERFTPAWPPAARSRIYSSHWLPRHTTHPVITQNTGLERSGGNRCTDETADLAASTDPVQDTPDRLADAAGTDPETDYIISWRDEPVESELLKGRHAAIGWGLCSDRSQT